MGDLLLVTGDSSADNYARRLVERLQEDREFTGKIYAAAGDETAGAGARLVENLVKNSVVGFLEVITSLPYFFSVARRLEELIENKDIETVLFMDFPGFNMRLARRLEKYDVNLLYYITPQVWAWGRRRLSTLREIFDELFVIFPFEEDYLADKGIKARFVGHPLLEMWEESEPRPVRKKLEIDSEKQIISFFPGSRAGEIRRHLPVMLPVIQEIHENYSGWQPVLSRARSVQKQDFKKYISELNFNLPVWTHDSRSLLKESELSVLGSGTVTMEAAFTGTPMLVGYRTSWISYYLGRFLVDIDRIAMPNLVDRRVQVPEFVQSEFNPETLLEETVKYLEDSRKRDNFRGRLELLKSQFEGQHPTAEVTSVLKKYLNKT